LRYTYPKSARLLQRSEFVTLMHKGRSFTGQYVVIQWRRGATTGIRLGVTISKKFGKAHERNRFKRLVREAFRLLIKPNLSIDLNVRPRKQFPLLTLSAVIADFTQFFGSFVD